MGQTAQALAEGVRRDQCLSFLTIRPVLWRALPQTPESKLSMPPKEVSFLWNPGLAARGELRGYPHPAFPNGGDGRRAANRAMPD